MEIKVNKEIKVEYLNQEARIVVDMDNTAETYLKRGITKDIFFNFVNQIVEMMDKGIKYNLCAEYDLDKMAVDGEIIYFRICIGKCELDMSVVKSYLKELAYKSVFQGNDFLQTLYEYLAFLDSDKAVSIEAIKKQIQIWLYGHSVENEDSLQKETEQAVNVETEQVRKVPEEEITDFADYAEPVFMEQNSTKMLSDDNRYPDYGADNFDNGAETGVLNPDFWNNIMKKCEVEEQPGRVRRKSVVASLFYIKMGKKITIDKMNFTIGKGKEVDCIMDNASISRLHAKIVCQDSKYFIMDNASTNGTYVNGKLIEPNQFVEINNGDLLRFSNEEMKFFVV